MMIPLLSSGVSEEGRTKSGDVQVEEQSEICNTVDAQNDDRQYEDGKRGLGVIFPIGRLVIDLGFVFVETGHSNLLVSDGISAVKRLILLYHMLTRFDTETTNCVRCSPVSALSRLRTDVVRTPDMSDIE